ncbi:feruloyl esterase-like protein B [Annulohypoxylon maeteangense]|uniref:feruloyl esterase-like protein B n=1 Tax=Annulohypoxylon maeteangense TaxID=1927788 RepID=UPI002008CB0E|nr:feruloyl esterase-like protein B [Annulohypoxylon maeteangense]KAI0890766.1 feruloyl esterase-like protein B [Annulohypoxylon maeteangense]
MRCSGFLQLSINLAVVVFSLLAAATAAQSNDNTFTINNHRTKSRRQTNCNAETFANVLPSSAKVEKVEYVSAGSTFGEPLTDLMYPISPTNLPELCAVIISVASSSVSAYRFGIFLPAEWNGRFLTVGNGGFGGGINWLDMGAGVRYGFAVVSTDTGHNSTTADIRWAFNQPEMRTDWGYRAVHGTVQLSKTLVATYYAKPISHSYYSGCSTGGRQGLKEVQISPDSFDGVLVGAPAWYTDHLNTWVGKIATYNWPAVDSKHIPWESLKPIGAEIVRQCDANDGVSDGIISLPEQCTVNWTDMKCTSNGGNTDSDFAKSTNCMNDDQIGTLQKMYDGFVLDATGEQIMPGYLPGSEAQMYTVLNYSDASPYGVGYIRYFVLNDPLFMAEQYNDSILQLAESLDPGNSTADNYNLTTFRDRGGKILLYHGAADGLVPTTAGSLYYNRTVETTSGGNVTQARDYFRRMEIPGMQHCGMTAVNAPWAFGGATQAASLGNDTYSVPGYSDAQHDILLALVNWVEKGEAVDQVVATTWKTSTDPSSGVLRQRPICMYPDTATWDGSGDVDKATSWSCGLVIFPPPFFCPVFGIVRLVAYTMSGVIIGLC